MVPEGTPEGVILNAFALHMDVVCVLTDGVGLIVTVTLNVAPLHDPDTGVTTYVAVTALVVVFVSV